MALLGKGHTPASCLTDLEILFAIIWNGRFNCRHGEPNTFSGGLPILAEDD